ncbi:MAG: hypothetical protein RDU30_15275 [Desulfovibrionaceae bacterium]|nr:hypothetical protein [Desulfovibrionaceae bacterium]
MNETEFRGLMEKHLLPMLPGCSVTIVDKKSNKKNVVSDCDGKTGLKLYPACLEKHIIIKKRQRFNNVEKAICRNFIRFMAAIDEVFGKEYQQNVEDYVMSKVIAASCDVSGLLGTDNSSIYSETLQFISSVLRTFSEWSQQTYENQKIAVSVGIERQRARKSVSFEEYSAYSFSKIFGNGYDSLVVFSPSGIMLKHESFGCNANILDEINSPIRFSLLANWTRNGKIAISLLRNGDILIFNDGSLLFAKRRGVWRYFSHDSVITQMSLGTPNIWKSGVINAVYRTALDVAFAKTGGCIGVILKNKINDAIDIVNNNDLMVHPGNSDKIRLMTYLFRKCNTIYDISRRLRQEIAAIDGALIIGYNGKILAIGAILEIQSGSTGGGRTAAAKALSQYGLGIKISNDGNIEIYKSGEDGPFLSLG